MTAFTWSIIALCTFNAILYGRFTVSERARAKRVTDIATWVHKPYIYFWSFIAEASVVIWGLWLVLS